MRFLKFETPNLKHLEAKKLHQISHHAKYFKHSNHWYEFRNVQTSTVQTT